MDGQVNKEMGTKRNALIPDTPFSITIYGTMYGDARLFV